MGKFALQLLVAKETWKHLSDRSQPKTFLSTYYIYTHTYLHFLNESFWTGGSASLWNSSRAERGRWWMIPRNELDNCSNLMNDPKEWVTVVQILWNQAGELGSRVEDWVEEGVRYNSLLQIQTSWHWIVRESDWNIQTNTLALICSNIQSHKQPAGRRWRSRSSTATKGGRTECDLVRNGLCPVSACQLFNLSTASLSAFQHTSLSACQLVQCEKSKFPQTNPDSMSNIQHNILHLNGKTEPSITRDICTSW